MLARPAVVDHTLGLGDRRVEVGEVHLGLRSCLPSSVAVVVKFSRMQLQRAAGVGAGQQHHRSDGLHLLHGAVRDRADDPQDQVRVGLGDRLHARLGAGSDIDRVTGEWRSGHPRGVAGDVSHTHGLHAEGDDVLGVVPLQRHHPGCGGGQGDLLTAAVGDGDRTGAGRRRCAFGRCRGRVGGAAAGQSRRRSQRVRQVRSARDT